MAFVCGLLIASLVNGRPQNDVAALVQIVAVLGLGYCLAHLFVVNVVIAGRIKRRNAALARGETSTPTNWKPSSCIPTPRRHGPTARDRAPSQATPAVRARPFVLV